MTTWRRTWPDRVLLAVAILIFLATAFVIVQRIAAARAAADLPPGTTQTSGAEEETMFSLWRETHGLPVYCDVTQPPYAAAYFNWLFYKIYGAVIPAQSGGPGRSWSPFAGRWLTALSAVLGAVIMTGIASPRQRRPALRIAAAALAAFLFCGPPVGWWIVTLRPDVMAMVAEAAGLLSFLAWHQTRPAQATAAALILFYVAWALKPISLGGLIATSAFLLVHRQWRNLGVLGTGSISLWLLTLGVGSPLYRASILETAGNNVFYPAAAVHHLWHVTCLSAPFVIGLPWWLVALIKTKPWRQRSFAHDSLLLASLGAPIVTLLCSLASAKLGAAGNYFFTPILLLGIGTVCGLWPLQRSPFAPVLACTVALVLSAGISFGVWGTLSLTPAAEQLALRWATFRQLPEPRFASDKRLELPWLNPHSPPIVPAYNYPTDRARGRSFTDGGIGGMIEQDKFAALLLFASAGYRYDGANLSRYHQGETVAGLTVFRLQSRGPGLP